MKIIETIDSFRELRKHAQDQTIGFVPTMGYLHEGHLSLIDHAGRENDIVVLSIFVNPLQFGAGEDLESYPRDRERDIRLAEQAGVDWLFMPSNKEMYPQPMQHQIKVSDGLTGKLCGASRPGHFDGVVTVVIKLLHIVQPQQLYLGMKDAQQVAVIDKLIRDFNFPVNVVACPTVRESDGLAKSSRNVNLTEAERNQAPALNQALSIAADQLANGTEQPAEVRRQVKAYIQQHAPSCSIDYVEITSFPELQDVSSADSAESTMVLVAVAVKFSRVRLIDNRVVQSERKEGLL